MLSTYLHLTCLHFDAVERRNPSRRALVGVVSKDRPGNARGRTRNQTGPRSKV